MGQTVAPRLMHQYNRVRRQIELMSDRHRALEEQAARILREALNVKDDLDRLMDERDDLSRQLIDLSRQAG